MEVLHLCILKSHGEFRSENPVARIFINSFSTVFLGLCSDCNLCVQVREKLSVSFFLLQRGKKGGAFYVSLPHSIRKLQLSRHQCSIIITNVFLISGLNNLSSRGLIIPAFTDSPLAFFGNELSISCLADLSYFL